MRNDDQARGAAPIATCSHVRAAVEPTIHAYACGTTSCGILTSSNVMIGGGNEVDADSRDDHAEGLEPAVASPAAMTSVAATSAPSTAYGASASDDVVRVK